MAIQDDIDAFAAGLKPRVLALAGGGMLIGDRIQYNASTTLTVADHEALAPGGFELWGWHVICIGAGGAASATVNGLGGWREEDLVSKDVLAGASTIAITVGAAAVNTTGGYSAFGTFVIGAGGEKAADAVAPSSEVGLYTAYNGSNWVVMQEGIGPGFGCPSGHRGAAGGSSTAVLQTGGCCYPHPNSVLPPIQGIGRPTTTTAVPTTSQTNMNIMFLGLSNPNTAEGAAGHAGIGDWPGGGGNYNSSGLGGMGGFPGGGAGAGTGNQRGGHGTVIVYPIFRKAI